MSSQILFTYQFRETHSKYHIMVSYSAFHIQRALSMSSDSALFSPHPPLPFVCLSVFCQTRVAPHSSLPRSHYADLDSEDDVSSDDLRDPDIDHHDDDSDTEQRSDRRPQQQKGDGGDDGDGEYRGGKYRAFQVSKHSLFVRAIARYRHDDRQRAEDTGERRRSRAKQTSAKWKKRRTRPQWRRQ